MDSARFSPGRLLGALGGRRPLAPLAGKLPAWKPVPMLIPTILKFGGASLLAVSAVDAWGLYGPLIGLTGLRRGWAGRCPTSAPRPSWTPPGPVRPSGSAWPRW
jgi:hypothetical protein